MVISPDNIKLLSTVDAPVIREPEDSYDSVVLLFPGEYAKEMTELSEAELKAIKKVVIIDSTWNQTRRYMYSENIRNLKMVKIQTEKTVFWRYQKGDIDNSLSSAEALYFFFRDYEVALNCENRDYSRYDGKFDNLLWFYAYNFKLIQEHYTKSDKKFGRIEGFLQKNVDKIFSNQEEKKD